MENKRAKRLYCPQCGAAYLIDKKTKLSKEHLSSKTRYLCGGVALWDIDEVSSNFKWETSCPKAAS